MCFVMSQKAIFLMGVAGSGKTTIQPDLLAEKDFHFAQVNTTTTRPMRDGEVQGEMYDFVSDEIFEKMKDADAFVEYALVHQKYYYATPKQAIEDAFVQGNNVLKQVDILGWEQIMEQDDVREYARSVFMDVSDETMRARMVARDVSITEEEILRRLESAQYERVRAQELCDVVVEVDHMTKEEQVDVIKEIVAELLEG